VLDVGAAMKRAKEAIKALVMIAEARGRLLARATRIREPKWSRSFLENVPENARTMRLAAHWAKGESDLLI
jgi:hypothetical protein